MDDPLSYNTGQLVMESVEYDDNNMPIENNGYRKTVNFASLLDRIAMDLPVYNIDKAKTVIEDIIYLTEPDEEETFEERYSVLCGEPLDFLLKYKDLVAYQLQVYGLEEYAIVRGWVGDLCVLDYI